MQCEYRAVIALKWFATEACIQLNWHALRWQKTQFVMPKRIICYVRNVENHAIFGEGFWPKCYACGRFMKYSMSVPGSKPPGDKGLTHIHQPKTFLHEVSVLGV